VAFIRFVVGLIDEDSGRRLGLFHAISELRKTGELLPHEESACAEISDWFSDNLKKPASFSRSARPHAKNVAISWFRDSAKEHIRRMHALSQILRAHHVHVEVIQSQRIGYVVYEDEHQVTAEPFCDTRT